MIRALLLAVHGWLGVPARGEHRGPRGTSWIWSTSGAPGGALLPPRTGI